MLNLHVENKDQSEPVVKLSWTITKNTHRILLNKKVENPLLFLSIRHNGKEVDRKLIPLKQGMEYVTLNHVGRNTIRAFIVWAGDQDLYMDQDILTKNLLSKQSHDTYHNYLYTNSYFENEYLKNLVSGCIAGAVIDINVGPEFFAKEPSAFEKWWVNLWFEYPARDQCQFRRRRFVAYTIQIPVIMLFVPWLFILRSAYALFATVFGRRNVQFSAIIHPFNMSTNDVVGYGTNFFITDKEGNHRPNSFLLLHPLFWGFVILMLFSFNRWHLWNEVMLGVGFVVAIIALAVILIFGKEVLIPSLERVVKQGRSDISDIIVKNSANKVGSQRMTIYLRYKALKAIVCKPFAS